MPNRQRKTPEDPVKRSEIEPVLLSLYRSEKDREASERAVQNIKRAMVNGATVLRDTRGIVGMEDPVSIRRADLVLLVAALMVHHEDMKYLAEVY